jgi:hypothetical protein
MPELLTAVIVAALGLGGGVLTARYGRVGQLSRELDVLRAENRTMWLVARALVDELYTNGSPPPQHLIDLLNGKEAP